MRVCYPDLAEYGWHFEAIATFQTFGVGIALTWGQSYVLWLGPLTLMFWYHAEPIDVSLLMPWVDSGR